MNNPLLIRADASSQIGIGHVMRTLALAQAWQAYGPVVFVSAECPTLLEQRLAAENCTLRRFEVESGSAEDAQATAALARDLGAAWVVADGYRFDVDFQRTLCASGARLLLLDDYGHLDQYEADLILNQNLGAEAGLYERSALNTRLLLGSRYALLRSDFLKWSSWKRQIPAAARKVLVTLGGGDPDNVTLKAIDALRDLDVETKVVIGGSNPHRTELMDAFSHPASHIQFIVDSNEMPELMAWADVAVAAAGGTSWELAFFGLPSVVMVLAENQKGVATALDDAGVSVNLGRQAGVTAEDITVALRSVLSDAKRRSSMSHNGRQLVDGEGTDRVVQVLRAKKLRLRPARVEDARLLWIWANNPAVRRSAFSSEPIPWEEHLAWFQGKRSCENSVLWIGVNEKDEPIGQIRFDWMKNGDVETDISVAPLYRGRGYSVCLIEEAIQRLVANHNVHTVHAWVRAENQLSARTFERAGFVPADRRRIHDTSAVHLVWQVDHGKYAASG